MAGVSADSIAAWVAAWAITWAMAISSRGHALPRSLPRRRPNPGKLAAGGDYAFAAVVNRPSPSACRHHRRGTRGAARLRKFMVNDELTMMKKS
jgi:hypothetical protein